MLGAGTENTLGVFFVTNNLHAPASFFGYTQAAFGVGGFVGALTAGALIPRLRPNRTYAAGLLGIGTMLVVYSRLTTGGPAYRANVSERDWLGRRDSNPNNLLQRQVSYR